jgi:hypothetical protein
MNASVQYRLSVASRVLAAAVGGYALASACGTLLSLILPMQHAQAAKAGTYLSFAVYAVILCWAFHTRSATRAWVWLAAWTAAVAMLCWWLLRQGGAA